MHRFVLFFLLSGALLAQKAPFDVYALMRLARISDPQLSPDGKLVAFTVQRIELYNNTRPRQIYLVPLNGGVPRPIGPFGGNNERARWSPDSTRIAFISDLGGSSQVWIMNADGSNPKKITSLSTEAGGVVFSPDGTKVLFTSEVFPGCADDACNQKLDAEKNNPVKARLYDSLLYRHWSRWQSKRRSHLFSVPLEGGTPKDLTPGPHDVPPFSLGGPDDYAIAPDGKEVCFVMKPDERPALSTNSDLYVVEIEGGEARKITLNPAADNSPQYSPDGRYLAYRSQARPGYESDRWRLTVLERATGKVSVLAENLDRWVSSFAWSPDSGTVFFTVEDRGRQAIHFVPVAGGATRVAVAGSSQLDDIQFTPDGKTMVYTQQSGSSPVEIYRASSSGGSEVPLTHLNDAVLSSHQLMSLESFWVEGAEQARVQSFLLKPPDFDPKKKYPVLMLIHGGPQSAWGESWSYRWNPQVFAAAGYVVVMPNPRGSTGYGQKFTDEINQDWGGRVYDDIMAVADHVAGLIYTDRDRMAAGGGSYGGYMVNWILGHTTRFRALVSHAGVFDLRSEAGETEELWFPIWDFGGMPWDNPEVYARWSPSYFVKEFSTPTLVIHGELDFRVPYGQGLQLFTALQMQRVPSRLLIYPDEGHWILKPQNSVLWYKTLVDWIDSWTKK
jgi:dipeptidyl aminopeptidase/acylaminoacyl peptidase